MIHWGSEQQSIVAQSLKDLELIFLASCACVVIRIQNFKQNIGRDLSTDIVIKPFNVVIRKENQARIADAQNDGLSDLSKQVNLKYQVLFVLVRKGTVRLEYVPSEETVADLLTKNWQFPNFPSSVKLSVMN